MTSRDPALSFPRPPSASPLPSQSHHSSRTLLLVMGETADAGSIRRALEGASDLTLISASTLAEGRTAIRERNPAIVVADQSLPDGQGSQLIEPDGGQKPPVIILMNAAIPGSAGGSSGSGPIGYVEKTPEGLAELPLVVDRGLREWGLLEQGQSVESGLEGSETRIRAILDAIPDLIFIHDRDGRVLECEGGSGTELGERRGELIGRELSQLVVPFCAPRLVETIRAVCTDGKTRTALYETDLPGSNRVFDSKLVRYEQMKVLAILRDITDRHKASAQIARLSPREHDVLSLIVDGKTNKAIGVRLGIGIKTVETHRANIMKKLKARTVAELLKLAFAAERH